ncbi:hypothetical protein Hanom_Chr16g01420111 [Helianthus anomalus]
MRVVLQTDQRQIQQQQLLMQSARVSYNNGDHKRDNPYGLSTEIVSSSY